MDPLAGLLLVNLGKYFEKNKWGHLALFDFIKLFWKIYKVEISKKNNKGVLGRPWTKSKVLKAISSTLKFQFTVKC